MEDTRRHVLGHVSKAHDPIRTGKIALYFEGVIVRYHILVEIQRCDRHKNDDRTFTIIQKCLSPPENQGRGGHSEESFEDAHGAVGKESPSL